MKKYETTKEHPDLKERIILTEIDNQYEFKLGHKTFFTGVPCINSWIRKGYIKEVQKKEFTESDMIGFHYWAGSVKEEEVKEDFNDWKKLK